MDIIQEANTGGRGTLDFSGTLFEVYDESDNQERNGGEKDG